MNFLGVDIGCSSIKYCVVDLGDEIKVQNFNTRVIAQTSREEKYNAALKSVFEENTSYHAAGFGFPSIVRDNVVLRDDVHFNDIWTGIQNFHSKKNIPSFATNDADASGIAEVYRKEAVELRKGVTIVLTLGTGIGSAIFMDGLLLPNTELGLIEIHGIIAEEISAPSVKTKESLPIQEWASRLQEYLVKVELLLSPDHLVLGGGISVDFNEFQSLLTTRVPIQAAYYRNQSGAVGSAIYAAYQTHFYDGIPLK